MRGVLRSAGPVVVLTFVLSACAPYTRDEKEFEQLVSSWQLVGRTTQDAMSLLEARGFKVSRIREGNNPTKPELFPEALFASRRGGLVPCVIGDLEWRVVGTIGQETITKVRTFIFMHCL